MVYIVVDLRSCLHMSMSSPFEAENRQNNFNLAMFVRVIESKLVYFP